KYTKAKPKESGVPKVDLAIPAFGYKNHVSIDRHHGLIRKWTASNAAAFDGARLIDVLDKGNTANAVWADTAYRSQKNEEMLAKRGFVSRIHRKKPKGRPGFPDLIKRNSGRGMCSGSKHWDKHPQRCIRIFLRSPAERMPLHFWRSHLC